MNLNVSTLAYLFPYLFAIVGLGLSQILIMIANHTLSRYGELRFSPPQPFLILCITVTFIWIGATYAPNNPDWLAATILAIILILVTLTDLKQMVIPNSIVFSGVLIAIAFRLWYHPLSFGDYVLAAVLGFAILYGTSFIRRDGVGGGDIKLYVFIGLMSGVVCTLLSLFLASLLGAMYGILGRTTGRLKPKQPIPFAPFIALASLISFVYGEQWMNNYYAWLAWGDSYFIAR
jgi:prepilin signal peptidase PulO-like enzyme (type II secretory pathway)